MLSSGGKAAKKGKGDLSREKWSGAHRWQGGNYWAGLRLRLSELLGRVEVAAGAASACRPWTKADTHGTSNGAVLHNFNLNNDCNSCVKDVQSVRRSSCQVFTRFYLQTWPAESAVQTWVYQSRSPLHLICSCAWLSLDLTICPFKFKSVR